MAFGCLLAAAVATGGFRLPSNLRCLSTSSRSLPIRSCCLNTHNSNSVLLTWFTRASMTTIHTVLSFNHPQSEGWPHILRISLSFRVTLPQGVLSTSWCCPSRSCVVFLACMHLALFLALSLSPGNSLVSSWCDHSMLVSLLWQCLTVPC